MKILHLVSTIATGGAEMYLLTLCTYLQRQGHDVVVAYLKEHVKTGKSLRGAFAQAGIWTRPYSLLACRSLDNLHDVDIIHSHLPKADLVCAALHRGIPWVSTVHGKYARWRGGRIGRWLWRKALRRADAVIAISQDLKGWLVTKGISEGKSTVIHYGIELERYERANRTAGGTMKLIGSIGRLDPRKGHDTLIRAMPKIIKYWPDCELHIAGHDPDGHGALLQRLIDGLGLTDHVKLLGFVEDIPAFLSRLDVFALASTDEGFGRVLVEAMAAGVPIVASNIPAFWEINPGTLVRPGDVTGFAFKIIFLLSNPQVDNIILPCSLYLECLLGLPRAIARAALGDWAKRRAREFFSAEVMTQKTIAVYRKIGGFS